MVSIATARKIALSFEGAEELPHFERASFRINKKIFATMDEKNSQMVMMFDVIQQSVFSAYDNTIIYPYPNSWGKKGATIIELKKVRKEVLEDALKQSYCNKAPVKLAEKYRQDH